MERNRGPAVCIVRHNYYPDTHVRRDAEALAAAGYRVSVVALRRADQPARETLDGVEIYRLPVEHHRGGFLRYGWEYSVFFLLAFVVLTALHCRKRFRIVEVDNMPDLLIFCALIPKLTGARLIFYIFDNMPELLVVARGYHPTHPLVGALAFMERVSTAFADHVVVTQHIAQGVIERRGVPEGKISVVLNCPDERLFNDAVPRPERTGDGQFRITTHGAILQRFGIQTLLTALPELTRQIPEIHVEIYGDGEFRPKVAELASHLALGERVLFRGFVAPETLAEPLRNASVGYVGMLCNLMLSNKLMEYVALGVPVVVARWPTYERYFPDNAVTYFEPGNVRSLVHAIVEIYQHPDQAERKAAHAKELYLNYRWSVQRETYLALYRELADSGARRGVHRTPPVAAR